MVDQYKIQLNIRRARGSSCWRQATDAKLLLLLLDEGDKRQPLLLWMVRAEVVVVVMEEACVVLMSMEETEFEIVWVK